MSARNLLLIALFALLAFGGSFTCTTSSGDHHTDFPVKPH